MGAIGIVFKVKHLIRDTNIQIHHKFLETQKEIKKVETIQIKMDETTKTNTLALKEFKSEAFMMMEELKK